ncbi:glycosyltransferase family protein [Magnetospirillum gryphiswaldense]|uniref:Glycosyl transferase family n=1 Tax=Magnetospirillum gryphiswaldense TaxID=55518 RepID=A4U197_9PROT|nr:glycosyltransferase [Magnetospirillum gryphiswaldense]AVM75565.1 hypothetical protein MSR1_30990 [Magnetospirillum gryphiswaldense MSR-1]AVM79468.1 hypothetical protein MSR1L_30990 [Magnetospirillum gryphiswaldense]CAM76654.1 glycosyl transferase family [Magnetospirillum gryphiswaldense MSR-1]
MRLILVGEANPGSRTPQRLAALRRLGHDVAMVPTTLSDWTYETRPGLLYRLAYHLRLPLDPAGANLALADAATAGCDAVILDNARMIRPSTLRRVRMAAPQAKLIWYSEDDSMNAVHRSRWIEGCMPLFDLWVTTKSFNAEPGEVPSLGVHRVLFVDNSFCPHDHAPLAITESERRQWGAPVSFVGTFEAARAADLAALAQADIEVRVWGNGWQSLRNSHPCLHIEGRPVYGEDYRRVVAASDLNLCFLRKGNRDRQTCRSLELPAMGAAMLHEASPEVERLFHPDREAVYFADQASLIAAARHWLAATPAREQLKQAARRRAISDGHDHDSRWRFILAQAMEDTCAS